MNLELRGLRAKALIITTFAARLKCLRENRVAASAALSDFPLYPGLTPRANVIPPLSGWV